MSTFFSVKPDTRAYTIYPSDETALKFTIITFEDDTFRVLKNKINEEVKAQILNMYSDIGYIAEFEEVTSLVCGFVLPSELTFLYNREIPLKLKNDLFNEYIPLRCKQISIKNKLNSMTQFSSFNLSETTTRPSASSSTNGYYQVQADTTTKSVNNSTPENSSNVKSDYLPVIGYNENASKKSQVSDTPKINIPTYLSDGFSGSSIELKVSSKLFNPAVDKVNTFQSYESPVNFFSRKHGPYGMQSGWGDFSDINYTYNQDNPQCYIYFNLKSLKTLVKNKEINYGLCQPDDPYECYSECGFTKICCFSGSDALIGNVLFEFHNKFHNSVTDLEVELEKLAIKINPEETFENYSLKNEKQMVKQYIETTYKIVPDIQHKIKASVLISAISEYLSCFKIDGNFNVRLSNYLKELGIQKKRYNDGYYYYGLEPKHSNESISSNPRQYVETDITPSTPPPTLLKRQPVKTNIAVNYYVNIEKNQSSYPWMKLV